MSVFTIGAVDPGHHVSGISVWECVVEDKLSTPKLTSARLVSTAAVPVYLAVVDGWHVEKPMHYHAEQKVEKDIVGLLAVVEWLRGEAKKIGIPHFQTFTPAQWKGQLPKAVVFRRLQALLTEGEWALIQLEGLNAKNRSDVLDAVGIGAVGTGRCRVGIIPHLLREV